VENFEIIIATRAYKAGYEQACEDFVKAFMQARRQALDSAMRDVTKKMGINAKHAAHKYFDALINGEKEI